MVGQSYIKGKSIDGLQFFAGLEADRIAGRDVYFSSGAGIAAYASFAGANIEDAESAQLDAIAMGESFLHALKDNLHRSFRFRLGDARLSDNLIDDVQLDHRRALRLLISTLYTQWL